MRALLSLSRAMFLGLLRDRVAIFFTFVFPLLFLVVFGLLFSEEGGEAVELAVTGSGPVLEALPPGAVEVHRYDTWDEAVAAVQDGDQPGALRQLGTTVELRFAASDQVQAGTVQGLVAGVVGQTNQVASGQPPRFRLDAQPVEDESLTPIQYLTPGILSWGVAISAAFGAALTLVAWRRKRLLRRLRLTPTRTSSVLLSRVGVSIVVAVLQAVLYVAVALMPPFGLQLIGQWWWALPLLVVGTLAFLAVGLLVGAFAKTEEAASAVVNVVILPMAFLSGTFFPLDQTPAWVQSVSLVLPLRHLTDGMLDVMVRGEGVGAIVVPGLILVGFTVVIGAVAVWAFRWDE